MNGDDWRNFLGRYRTDSTHGRAKYKTLRDAIVAAIEEGYWKPGDRLPTELELSRASPYSLGTVQRAMRALVDEGVIVRRQGDGTFLRGGLEQMEDPWHYRFLDDNGNGFLTARVVSTTVSRMNQPGRWSKILSRVPQGILRVQRIVGIGNEFKVLSRLYLKADDVESIMTELRHGFDWVAVRKSLTRHTRFPVAHVSESLAVSPLPDDVARLIGIPERAIGMHIESIARTGHSHYLYYQQLFVPPTRRRLHIAIRTHREPERRNEVAAAPTPEEPPE